MIPITQFLGSGSWTITGVNNVTSVIVEDFTSNLHIVNKNAYTFNLVKTSDNSLNSRLQLNKGPLSPGEYTTLRLQHGQSV